MTSKYSELPKLVHHWLTTYNIYLVGSGAQWFVGEDKTPNDLDLIACTDEHFHQALRTLPETIRTNTMGGIKARLRCGTKIDIWPHSLRKYLEQMSRKNYNGMVAVTLDPCICIRAENI